MTDIYEMPYIIGNIEVKTEAPEITRIVRESFLLDLIKKTILNTTKTQVRTAVIKGPKFA